MNEQWKPILKLENSYMLLAHENGKQYNLAWRYNAEDNTWGQGHYCSTLDDCLVCYLRLRNRSAIKSKTQMLIESRYGITYERLDEIASKSLYMIINDEYTREDLEELDFTARENEYFQLGLEDEEQDR